MQFRAARTIDPRIQAFNGCCLLPSSPLPRVTVTLLLLLPLSEYYYALGLITIITAKRCLHVTQQVQLLVRLCLDNPVLLLFLLNVVRCGKPHIQTNYPKCKRVGQSELTVDLYLAIKMSSSGMFWRASVCWRVGVLESRCGLNILFSHQISVVAALFWWTIVSVRLLWRTIELNPEHVSNALSLLCISGSRHFSGRRIQ